MLPEGGRATTWCTVTAFLTVTTPDFVLFGVTAEEIRWLQSGVVVPHVTVRPLRRSRHLRQWARRERPSRTRRCGAPVLSSLRPSSWGLHGHLPSLGSCARRVGDVAPVSRYHLRRSRTARCGPPSRLPCASASTASFSLKIKRRFMRRVAHRIRPRELGCPIHKKQLLPVLVVWAPPRKKRKGATCPERDHVALGRRVSSSEPPTAS